MWWIHSTDDLCTKMNAKFLLSSVLSYLLQEITPVIGLKLLLKLFLSPVPTQSPKKKRRKRLNEWVFLEHKMACNQCFLVTNLRRYINNDPVVIELIANLQEVNENCSRKKLKKEKKNESLKHNECYTYCKHELIHSLWSFILTIKHSIGRLYVEQVEWAFLTTTAHRCNCEIGMAMEWNVIMLIIFVDIWKLLGFASLNFV